MYNIFNVTGRPSSTFKAIMAVKSMGLTIEEEQKAGAR